MALSARRDQIRERRAFEDLTPAGARRLRKAVDDPLTHEATEARLMAREADGVPAWMHDNAREQQLGAVADGLGPDDVARWWATYEDTYGDEDDRLTQRLITAFERREVDA